MRSLSKPACGALLVLALAASCSSPDEGDLSGNAGLGGMPQGGTAASGAPNAGGAGGADSAGGSPSAGGGGAEAGGQAGEPAWSGGGAEGVAGSPLGGGGLGGAGGHAGDSPGGAGGHAGNSPGGAGGYAGDPAGGVGGTDSSGGMAGGGGTSSIVLPGHAGEICDPEANYPSPLPATPGERVATRISEGYFFTEGPVWVQAGGYLLFTDMVNVSVPPYAPGGHVRRFTPPNTFDTFITDSDSNGLAISADDATLFAARRIKANAGEGELASYPITTQVKSTVLGGLESPNDLTLRSDGNIYFTDGDALVRRDASGNVSVADQVASHSPNGVALSPDEVSLYGGWSNGTIRKSSLAEDGTPSAAAPFATMQNGGAADGMTVDCAGNLYVADYANGKVQVFDASGSFLGEISVPSALGPTPPAEHATNVAFGGSQHKTLYITAVRGNWSDPAVGELHQIMLSVPGLPY